MSYSAIVTGVVLLKEPNWNSELSRNTIGCVLICSVNLIFNILECVKKNVRACNILLGFVTILLVLASLCFV